MSAFIWNSSYELDFETLLWIQETDPCHEQFVWLKDVSNDQLYTWPPIANFVAQFRQLM